MKYKLCIRDRYGEWTQWGRTFETISEANEMGETLVAHCNYEIEYKVRKIPLDFKKKYDII